MTPIRTLLADIHPKADDQPAIDRAAQLAAASGASVTLYLCDYLEPLTGGVFFHDDTMKAARDDYMQELRDWLRERARPLREQGIDTETRVEWHSPRFEAILSRADEMQADLIVRAASKRSRLDRLLLGATDWELVRRARQPLWLVKKALDLGTHEPSIVVAVDPAHPSDRKAGLDRKLIRTAEEIRGLFGGTLHLFHAYSPSAAVAPVATVSHHVAMPVLRMGGEIIEELRSQREQQVRELAKPAGIPDEHVHLVAGDASSALQELVEDHDIDIVVAGAVSRSRMERLLIGNTAEAILDDVACDLVVVKPDGFRSEPEGQR